VADLLMRVLKRFEKPQEETRDWWKKLGDDADQQ
jgi:hypothetical protein